MVDEVFERSRELSADRGLDRGALKAKLWREEKAMADYDPAAHHARVVPRAGGSALHET